MPGVTLPSAGACTRRSTQTKEAPPGPAPVPEAGHWHPPLQGFEARRRESGVGSVPRPLMRDPAPRAGLLRIWAGGCRPSRPVSARRIRATLQRGCSERGVRRRRDGCLVGRRGRPLAYSAGTSPSRWRTEIVRQPEGDGGNSDPPLVQVRRSDLSTEPTHNPEGGRRGSCLGDIFQRLDDTATLVGDPQTSTCRRSSVPTAGSASSPHSRSGTCSSTTAASTRSS
jgi:hypothetical protein